MDIQFLKELMREFKECELTKFQLKNQEFEIKLEKKNEYIPAQTILPTATYSASSQAETSPVVPVIEDKKQIEGHKITSPMVGTVYVAPSPDAPPFVKVGQKIKKGDVVCIIEAMKLMNEVESDIDGEVVEILACNEQMVEFGAPLFVVR